MGSQLDQIPPFGRIWPKAYEMWYTMQLMYERETCHHFFVFGHTTLGTLGRKLLLLWLFGMHFIQVRDTFRVKSIQMVISNTICLPRAACCLHILRFLVSEARQETYKNNSWWCQSHLGNFVHLFVHHFLLQNWQPWTTGTVHLGYQCGGQVHILWGDMQQDCQNIQYKKCNAKKNEKKMKNASCM